MGVEYAAQDEAQALDRGLDREAPGGTQDTGMRLRVILVIGLDDRWVRQRRMDIDRHVELGGPLPDRPEPLIVVKDAAGHAVDHRALEAELGDGALQFVGCGARVGGWHNSEGGKTIRV